MPLDTLICLTLFLAVYFRYFYVLLLYSALLPVIFSLDNMLRGSWSSSFSCVLASCVLLSVSFCSDSFNVCFVC